jgi:hypothetical protein
VWWRVINTGVPESGCFGGGRQEISAPLSAQWDTPSFLNAVFGPLLGSPFWTQIEASAGTFVMVDTFVMAGTYGVARSAIKEPNREGQL